jgi:hypothetical protein
VKKVGQDGGGDFRGELEQGGAPPCAGDVLHAGVLPSTLAEEFVRRREQR